METTDRNPQLWQKAKARAKFQSHLVVYLIVNAGLWLLWAFTNTSHHDNQPLPWPAWTSIFWGIGLLLQGFAAYTGLSRGQRTEREYQRLLREEGR